MECYSCHTPLPDDAIFCHACGSLQQGARETREYDYAAFISYRHLPEDQKAAIEIQRAIETYRLPKSLVSELEQDEAAEDHPERIRTRTLGKCFRDEDELAASHSLPAHIEQALRHSRSLVVICSPETPNSLWVLREIETFIHMHGRERIFTVLIDGSSDQSIPDLLKTRTMVIGDGTVSHVHSGPFAADLRPSAQSRVSLEKLRIIAAVAEYPLDDLRRRDLARKRKKIACSCLAIVAVAVALSAFALHAAQSNREAQINESQRLAAESEQLLEQGDRYGAIETALSALPANDRERPLVPEAQAALEKALGVTPHPSSVWTAGYSLQTEHPMGLLGNTLTHEKDATTQGSSAITVSNEGSFFALSDNEGSVATYDIQTGRPLAQCIMPESAQPLEGGLYSRTLATVGEHLIVSNCVSPGVVSCFDAYTGQESWSYENVTFPAVDASLGEGFASMVQPNDQGGFSVLLMNVLENKVVAACDFTDMDRVSAASGICTVTGNRFGDSYSAFGNKLIYAKLDTLETKTATLALPHVTSISYCNGVLVVATASEMPEDDVARNYAIEAFDDKLNPLWKHEGTFTSEMIDNGSFTTLLAAEPTIWGFTLHGEGVAISAGREALVLDAASGEPLFERAYDQTIVAMQPVYNAESNYNRTYIACSNGIITQKDLSGEAQDQEGDEERLVAPFPIRWACITSTPDKTTALLIPANDNDRIVAFSNDGTYGAKPDRDYTLDELEAMANEVLAEGGRGAF